MTALLVDPLKVKVLKPKQIVLNYNCKNTDDLV